jgi:hypothetical protein
MFSLFSSLHPCHLFSLSQKFELIFLLDKY